MDHRALRRPRFEEAGVVECHVGKGARVRLTRSMIAGLAVGATASLVACEMPAPIAPPPPPAPAHAAPVPKLRSASIAPSVELAPPLDLGEPTRVAVPDGFAIHSFAFAGTRLFAAGTDARGKLVRVGDVRGSTIAWGERVALPRKRDSFNDYRPEIVVDATPTGLVRLAIARNAEDWHETLLVLEETERGWARHHALPPWAAPAQVDGGFEFGYGSPHDLRGDELVTTSMSGSDIRPYRPGREANTTLLYFRRDANGWNPTVLPFADGATSLGWGIAISTDGDAIALMTEHGTEERADLYRREGTSFVPSVSLPIPGRAEGIVRTGSRMIVRADALVVLARGEQGWNEERRIASPDGPPPDHGWASAFAAPDRLLAMLRDGRLFQIDVEGDAAVRPMVFPAGVAPERHRKWAASASHLLGLDRDDLLLWALPPM
jgi:hypothetical protein